MKRYILLNFFLGCIIYSCSTVNYGNSYSKSIESTILKDGYWGEWQKAYSSKVYLGNENPFHAITIYSNSHPSDYDIKIQTESFITKDEKWYKYKGRVWISCFQDSFEGLGESYNNKVDLENCIENGNKISFSCEILSTHDINEVLKKKGTVNVFYNGVGRGYSFKNY